MTTYLDLSVDGAQELKNIYRDDQSSSSGMLDGAADVNCEFERESLGKVCVFARTQTKKNT
jgi:hypothetical protein